MGDTGTYASRRGVRNQRVGGSSEFTHEGRIPVYFTVSPAPFTAGRSRRPASAFLSRHCATRTALMTVCSMRLPAAFSPFTRRETEAAPSGALSCTVAA